MTASNKGCSKRISCWHFRLHFATYKEIRGSL